MKELLSKETCICKPRAGLKMNYKPISGLTN